MTESNLGRLSRIATLWSLVRRAHQEPDAETMTARQQLLERYGRAIHRYLLGALRDDDAANDLMQDFVLRFLSGDFHRADQYRGRFRDYLRTALIRMVGRHRRAEGRRPGALPADAVLAADEEPVDHAL